MVQEFVDEIKKLIDDTLNGVHTAMPGTISGASGMTATVKPSVTFKTADGKSKLSELMQWKVKADELFANDKARLDRIDAGQRVEQQGILALLDHGLDGNNVAQMEKAKVALQEHLINH